MAAIILGVCIVAGMFIYGAFNRYALCSPVGETKMYRIDKKTGKIWYTVPRSEYIVEQKNMTLNERDGKARDRKDMERKDVP